MKVESLLKKIKDELGCEFYTGVPDSQLKALCNYLSNTYGIDKRYHVIAANEGNCSAIAAGYHLATGKVPVVYMQNSGEGNIINPVASLFNDKVYGIPCVFIIGWRGEPGVHDEPQHIYQGEITVKLLDDMDISSCIVDKNTTKDDLETIVKDFGEKLKVGKQVAFVIKKGALSYDEEVCYSNNNKLIREEIIEHIVEACEDDVIISTTGKASRELFEIREKRKENHEKDFLTVGSMGHASSIALGVAINKPETKVWCIDGDGALLMHMGAMAVIGSIKPSNMVHVVINNEAHETVGGMPTVATNIDLPAVAKACGYTYTVSVQEYDDLDRALQNVKNINSLAFIEVKCGIGSRGDLGRPTTTALENKNNFMRYLDRKG